MKCLSRTLFPVPDGPRMTVISPLGMSKVTSSQMVCVPNRFVRPTTEIAVSGMGRHSRTVPAAAGKKARLQLLAQKVAGELYELRHPLVRDHVSGVRDEGRARVSDLGDKVVGVPGRCQLVLLAPHHQRGRRDPPEPAA